MTRRARPKPGRETGLEVGVDVSFSASLAPGSPSQLCHSVACAEGRDATSQAFGDIGGVMSPGRSSRMS